MYATFSHKIMFGESPPSLYLYPAWLWMTLKGAVGWQIIGCTADSCKQVAGVGQLLE